LDGRAAEKVVRDEGSRAIPLLASDESLVDLENGTRSTKSLYAVNSRNCVVRSAGNLIVNSNQVGTIRWDKD